MTTRFIHIRSADLPYLQGTSEHFGGITVAYSLWTSKDPDGASHLFANVALAICDYRDRYNKGKGRDVAAARLRHRVTFRPQPLLVFTTHLGYAAMENEVGVGTGKYLNSLYATLIETASGGIDVNEREIKVTKILRDRAIANGEFIHYNWA